MDETLYCYREEIERKEYVTAEYFMKLPANADIMKKAEALAVGQTIGTWVPIPGVTEEIKEKHRGKVVQIYDVPPAELEPYKEQEERCYVLQIAYPTCNLTKDFPILLTALLGNDASTSAQVKLLDIGFPPKFAEGFLGPAFGIEGVRKLTGEEKRPLLLNMIKPCTGLTPEEGAKVFYQVALGGMDFIKDDELLGNPSYSRPWDRVRMYRKAAQAAYERTGKKTVYIVNITDGAATLMDTARHAIDAGAEALMVNFAAVGYSALKQLTASAGVPVLAHSAGAGMFYEGGESGMSSPLAVGKLARMAGADMIMMNTPYGGYPLRYQKYMQTAQRMVLPFYGMRPSMPVVGGGVHPGMVERYINQLGPDIILAAGGAVIGHPMGAAAGARAMGKAVAAAVAGIPMDQAACESEELRKALEIWGETQ